MVNKKPTLVCLNNGAEPPRLTRYVPKPTGGFYTETFEITDPEQAARALNEATMEAIRRGQMQGQETPAELEDQRA